VADHPRTEDGRELHLFAPGHEIRGQLQIVNVGETRADILDGHCMVYWTQLPLPMRHPYEDGIDNLQADTRTLLSGQSTTVSFRSNRPVEAEIGAGMGSTESYDVYVMGWVTYADRNDPPTRRRTNFCRQYQRRGIPGRSSSPVGRFSKIDDVDYEHEE
jgi:hypothetical protein